MLIEKLSQLGTEKRKFWRKWATHTDVCTLVLLRPLGDPLQTQRVDAPCPKEVSFRTWNVLVEQFCFPQACSHSMKMRLHATFDHITSAPWKSALQGYRIKSIETWFVFPPAMVTSSASESVQLSSSGNQVWLCFSRNLTQPLSLWKAPCFPWQWWKGTPGRHKWCPLCSHVHSQQHAHSKMLHDWLLLHSKEDKGFVTLCKGILCSLANEEPFS